MTEIQTLKPLTTEFEKVSKIIYVLYSLYCLVSYVMMTYYSFYLLIFSDITVSHLAKTTHPYYDKLIFWALQYLSIDTVHKYFDRLYLKHYYTNENMYKIMLLHHTLGLCLTLYMYVADISHISAIALYTFEFTSIFLQLFALRKDEISFIGYTIKNFKHLSLWLFWLSFLVVRIVYGNIMTVYLAYLAFVEPVTVDLRIATVMLGSFLLTANNVWFYKLNGMYVKSKKNKILEY